MHSKIKLLCVDDDSEMRDIIRASLPSGVEFEEASNVTEAIHKIQTQSFGIILIDLNLGKGESGFKLIEFIKEKEFSIIPYIMIITGSDKDEDEIQGHQLEVTEYIKKPIRVPVFKALLSKYIMKFSLNAGTVKKVGPLKVDQQKMQVRLECGDKDEDLFLTLKEYKLLMKFMDSPGIAYTREQLYVEVWDASSEIQSRTIDMHVSALRKKLGNFGSSISSVRGVGYSFDPAKVVAS